MENLYKIEVKVKTEYIEYQSDPNRERYVFSYTVKIKNLGKIPAKLISRKWIITDANGKIEEVEGLGVIGEQPRLLNNESFEYTSGTPLKTTNGIMQGFYLMSQNNGEQLKIDIPAFSLDSPYNKKNFH